LGELFGGSQIADVNNHFPELPPISKKKNKVVHLIP